MNKKSDCKFIEKLNAYLDNELDEVDFKQLKDHLLNCPDCQAEIRAINKINDFLSSYQDEELPAYVKNRIYTAVSNISEDVIIRKNRFIKLTAAASVAAAFIIGLLCSSMSFQIDSDSLSEYSLGHESLYSYYITE